MALQEVDSPLELVAVSLRNEYGSVASVYSFRKKITFLTTTDTYTIYTYIMDSEPSLSKEEIDLLIITSKEFPAAYFSPSPTKSTYSIFSAMLHAFLLITHP